MVAVAPVPDQDARTPDGGVSSEAEAFVRCCMAHVQAARAAAIEDIRAGAEQVVELSERLRAASRSLHVARLRLAGLEASLAGERDRLELDFDQLLRLAHVRDVEVDGSTVRLLTDEVVIEHDGRRHRIGSFAIGLHLERGVRIDNLANTGAKPEWDHPHVQAGLPCLGNLRDGLDKLLGECQLVPVASMLVQFLETYDPDTAYCPIELWEEVAG
jgi:hypothetical protein